MHRLVRLFTALFIVYWGQSLLRAAEPTVSIALRDGGLILLMGLLLFAGTAPAGLWRRVRSSKSFTVAQKEVDSSHIAFGLVILFALMRLFIWNRWGLRSCLESGCAAGLRAQELLRTDDFSSLLVDPAPLFTLLTAFFFGLFGADLENLRLLGLLLGIFTVPALYLATFRIVGRATATVASLLLVFATWHIDLSFGADPNVFLILLLLLYLWAWTKSTEQNDSRWDIMAGLFGGLALLTTDPLPGILLLLWFILTAIQSRQNWLSMWPLAGVFMLLRLLLSSNPLASALSWSNRASEPGMRWEEAGMFLRLLLTQADVWPPVTGLLALLGLVYLLRYSRLWAEGRALLIGVLLILWLTLVAPVHLPLLLGLLLPVAVIGLAPFVAMFADVWRPVLRPVTSYAAASILLVALLGFGSVRGLSASGPQPTAPDQTASLSVIGRYLHEQFQISVDNGGEESTLIIVPAAVLNHPTTRLAAGGVLPFARHIIALDPVTHLPWADAPFNPQLDAGVEYVVPLAYLDLFALLRQLYSGVVVEPLLDEENAIVGWRFPLSREQVSALQGLAFAYVEGEQPDSNPEEIRAQAVFYRTEGPLLFQWQLYPPLQVPFHLRGQGLLYAPENGTYGFQMEIGPGAHAMVAVGLEAEQQVLLDSANGVTSNILRLRQGVMPIAITYTSGPDSTDFGLLWQRPAGKVEPIPRQALYTLPLESGLLVSYYSAEGEMTLNALERQPLLAERREPLLHVDNLPMDAVGVIWQGKLAAPVTGQYGFDLRNGQCSNSERECAPSSALLRVNGIDVVRSERTAEGTGGAILLNQGWHDFELRFLAAEEGPPVNLVWQAPGTATAPIPPQYFMPLLPSADTSSLAIPTEVASLLPPEVVDISEPEMAEGQENFTAPSSNELPTGLPELPLELEWQLGACGNGPDAFSAPKGISILPEAGTVYIADMGNRRVVVRSLTDGALLAEITSEEFEEPFDLDVNILGEVFLLDAVTQRIWRLDPSGLWPIDVTDTTFYRPRGLGVDIGGQFFVADTGGSRVVVLADGQVVKEFGGPGTQLEQPTDVLALANGAIWAISPDEGQLWRLDTGQGQMATARANTLDAPHFAGLLDSSFFLTDPEQRKVLYFQADGTPAGQFQAQQFVKPIGLAAAIQEERLLLAVSDTLACSVSVWSMPAISLP